MTSSFLNGLKLGALGLTVALGLGSSGLAKEQLNFVVIFTDDQGYGDMSCNGHPTIHTPNLDRMAHEGQKWTQFYMKVLTHFATDPNLHLRVSFEVAPEGGIPPNRVEEIKAALQELGLNPDTLQSKISR